MKAYKILALTFSVFIFFFTSCGNANKKQPKEGQATTNAQEQKLKNEAKQAWDKMNKNDNAKFESMKSALKQLSYNPKADTKMVEKINKEIENVLMLRYTIENVNLSTLENYDNLTTALIDRIDSLAEATPDMGKYGSFHPIMQEIREADEKLMYDRLEYDKCAKKYNELIVKDKKQKLPVFADL